MSDDENPLLLAIKIGFAMGAAWILIQHFVGQP